MAKEDKMKPEDIEKVRAENVRKTLENKLFQKVLGSNLVRSNPFVYGQLSHQGATGSYDQSSNDVEFNKERQGLYQEKVEDMRQSGVYGEPSMPSNSEVAQKIMNQLREVMQMSKVGELEKAAKSVAGDIDFKVPEELKDYVIMNVLQKVRASKGNDGIKLDEKEKDVLACYQLLSQTYERACALKSGSSGAYADIIEAGKEITAKYAPKEKK